MVSNKDIKAIKKEVQYWVERTNNALDIQKILANENRLLILHLCDETEGISISNLARTIGITYANLWNHVKKLEKLGVITCERKGPGKEVIVRMNRNELLKIHQRLSEFYKKAFYKREE